MTASPRDRIVTPASDPDRFTPREAALHAAGRCSYQDGYGLPGETYCAAASQPGAPFGYCDEHATGLLVDHWPDGTPRSATDPRYQDDPSYAARLQAALDAHHRACTTPGCPCREETAG